MICAYIYLAVCTEGGGGGGGGGESNFLPKAVAMLITLQFYTGGWGNILVYIFNINRITILENIAVLIRYD